MAAVPTDRRCAVAFRVFSFEEKESRMAFLCGLAAVRFVDGEPLAAPKGRIELWFYPHIPLRRRNWRLSARPETENFFGHGPAELYASGADPIKALHRFIAFTGTDRCIAYDREISAWREALSNLPADEGWRLKAMNRVSLNGVFKTMERRGMQTEPIQRRIREHDELYEFARLVGLESPLKVMSNRRTLADEAELIGRLWFAATGYMQNEDVRLGVKPERAWLAAYKRTQVRDLKLTLDTRIFLRSEYRERSIVRSLGAHWDREVRSWYINIWQDPMPFREWLSDGDFADLVELARRIGPVTK